MTTLATALHSATPTQWHAPIPKIQRCLTPFQALMELVEDDDDLCTQVTELLASAAPEAKKVRDTLGILLNEQDADGVCTSCDGTGEGQHEGASCYSCRGSGHV